MSSYYPEGAAYDSRAPWNDDDDDVYTPEDDDYYRDEREVTP